MLGERIRQARLSAGLSQRAAAERVGVSAMAISKYERNETTPSSRVLMSLARAFGVQVEYFFRSTEVELKSLEFRKHPQLPAKQQQRVLADAREQVERWLVLEELMPGEWVVSFRVPEGLPTRVTTYDGIEQVAQAVRESWRLGTEAIVDLVDVLEEFGLKVLLSEFANASRFDGLAAVANGHTILLVGKDLPGDCQRFTMAHELGHFVLKGRLGPGLDEEAACNRFTGAFLVPDVEVRRALGERRTWLEPKELWILKQQWGLSMGGWTYRALDLGIINRATMSRLWQMLRARGWDKREPGRQYPGEQPRRFERLVFRALAEDLIGESRAAELLGLSVAELADRRQMDFADESDHQ